jgi:hypothetical protein
MLAAWERRNSRQLGPDLRGAGPSPTRVSSRRTVVGDTRRPSLPRSPLIRRWPQRGFSRASRTTMSLISADVGGRPRRPGGCRHFLRTSARCHRSNVREVTRRASRDGRGRWQAAAESRARSAALRPRDLAAQNIELVAQDQQLDVLDLQATTTPNQCAEQSPEREVEEGEGHDRRSSPFSPKRARHEYRRPSPGFPHELSTDPCQADPVQARPARPRPDRDLRLRNGSQPTHLRYRSSLP